MDGIHDLGGMQGFGPVDVEPDEPVFHEPWERRMFGLASAVFAAGLANGGEFRHSIERMDPAHYLGSTYYEHWLTGIATILVEKGVVAPADLGAFPLSRPAAAVDFTDPGPDRQEPTLAVGDEVVVRDVHPPGHTRCPQYVRGKAGTVVRIDAASSLPDIEAHSTARRAEPIYSVRFAAADLWGDAAGRDSVYVDVWESWLEVT
jgi:nitrile hydratase